MNGAQSRQERKAIDKAFLLYLRWDVAVNLAALLAWPWLYFKAITKRRAAAARYNALAGVSRCFCCGHRHLPVIRSR